VIPQELRARGQWVVWRSEVRDGKPTKVPYQPSGDKASSTNPRTWITYEEATRAAARFDGIGFVLSKDDPLVGLDFDACRSANGLDEWVRQAVFHVGSYAELSPSGRGLHIIAKGSLNGHRNRTSDTPWGGKFEAYSHGRFFTMTGQVLDGAPQLEVGTRRLPRVDDQQGAGGAHGLLPALGGADSLTRSS
jgi:putative DNA primase/helicase